MHNAWNASPKAPETHHSRNNIDNYEMNIHARPKDRPSRQTHAHQTVCPDNTPDTRTTLSNTTDTLIKVRAHINACNNQLAVARVQINTLSATIDTLMTTLKIVVDTLPQDPAQDTYYDALSHATVGAMLFEHKMNKNRVATPTDVKYFSRIPAHLTRGDTNTPSRHGRPERGDVVIITRPYTSKVWGHQFPQLHLMGVVKYIDAQDGRVGITVKPDTTIEKSERNIKIVTTPPEYEPAHVYDLDTERL